MKQTFAAVLVASALALGASSATAQSAAPMTIEFVSSPDLEFPGVEAYIGTTLCAAIDFAETTTMQIGGPDAPAPCTVPWRVIELRIPGFATPMFITPVYEPGTVLTIDNFAPPPAVDGPDVHFGIEVVTEGLTVRDLKLLGGISAYVAGAHCGTAALDGDPDDTWIPVSHRDHPSICREYGQAITLVDGNGHVLVVSPTVGVGPFYRLENLAPYPPGSGPAAPVPAAAGHGTVEGARDASALLALLGTFGVALGLLVARASTRLRR